MQSVTYPLHMKRPTESLNHNYTSFNRLNDIVIYFNFQIFNYRQSTLITHDH